MVGLPEASSYVRAILRLLPPSRHAEFLRGLEQADEHGSTMVNGRLRTLEQYLDEWYWTAVTFGR